MKYTEFRDAIDDELRHTPAGLTWAQLKDRLALPYMRPCPSWVAKLEVEIRLTRSASSGRAQLWRVKSSSRKQSSRS